MAQILRLDDPGGSKDAETVRSDVNGQGYEVDLAEAGRQRFTGSSRSLFAAARGRSRSRSHEVVLTASRQIRMPVDVVVHADGREQPVG